VSTPLRLSRQVDEHAIIVRAFGEIDLATAPALHLSLREASELATPPTPVVADLSGVDFLASAGLSVLVELHELCRDQRTPLRVVASTLAARRSLRVTGLDQLLDVVDSPDLLRPA
jgi:anti-sigma B factor antagonist